MAFAGGLQVEQNHVHRSKLDRCIIVMSGKKDAGKTHFINSVSTDANLDWNNQIPDVKHITFEIDGTTTTFLEVPAFENHDFRTNAASKNCLRLLDFTRFFLDKKLPCNKVASVLYIWNTSSSNTLTDKFHLDMMVSMSGEKYKNRLGLILNQFPGATSPQDQNMRDLWPSCDSGRDPIIYSDGSDEGRSSEIVVGKILSARAKVLLDLIDEYGENRGMLHKTSAGEALSQQIADEVDEITRKIREVEQESVKDARKLGVLKKRKKEIVKFQEKWQKK